MKTILNLTKLGMILLIGILVGQFVFITFNTGLYFKGCVAPHSIAHKAPQAPSQGVEVENAQYTEDAPLIRVEGDEWLDHKATNN